MIASVHLVYQLEMAPLNSVKTIFKNGMFICRMLWGYFVYVSAMWDLRVLKHSFHHMPTVFLSVLKRPTGIAQLSPGNCQILYTSYWHGLSKENIFSGKPIQYGNDDAVVRISVWQSDTWSEKIMSCVEKLRVLINLKAFE